MINAMQSKLPGWFWILATLALLWNLIGVAAYLMEVTMSPEALAELPEAQSNLREATPAWVTGCYAIAVFAGTLGSIALLIRKTWAVPLFGISLAAVILQMGYVFGGMNAAAVLGASATILPIVIVLLGAAFLWFSMGAKKRGWLA